MSIEVLKQFIQFDRATEHVWMECDIPIPDKALAICSDTLLVRKGDGQTKFRDLPNFMNFTDMINAQTMWNQIIEVPDQNNIANLVSVKSDSTGYEAIYKLSDIFKKEDLLLLLKNKVKKDHTHKEHHTKVEVDNLIKNTQILPEDEELLTYLLMRALEDHMQIDDQNLPNGFIDEFDKLDQVNPGSFVLNNGIIKPASVPTLLESKTIKSKEDITHVKIMLRGNVSQELNVLTYMEVSRDDGVTWSPIILEENPLSLNNFKVYTAVSDFNRKLTTKVLEWGKATLKDYSNDETFVCDIESYKGHISATNKDLLYKELTLKPFNFDTEVVSDAKFVPAMEDVISSENDLVVDIGAGSKGQYILGCKLSTVITPFNKGKYSFSFKSLINQNKSGLKLVLRGADQPYVNKFFSNAYVPIEDNSILVDNTDVEISLNFDPNETPYIKTKETKVDLPPLTSNSLFQGVIDFDNDQVEFYVNTKLAGVVPVDLSTKCYKLFAVNDNVYPQKVQFIPDVLVPNTKAIHTNNFLYKAVLESVDNDGTYVNDCKLKTEHVPAKEFDIVSAYDIKVIDEFCKTTMYSKVDTKLDLQNSQWTCSHHLSKQWIGTVFDHTLYPNGYWSTGGYGYVTHGAHAKGTYLGFAWDENKYIGQVTLVQGKVRGLSYTTKIKVDLFNGREWVTYQEFDAVHGINEFNIPMYAKGIKFESVTGVPSNSFSWEVNSIIIGETKEDLTPLVDEPHVSHRQEVSNNLLNDVSQTWSHAVTVTSDLHAKLVGAAAGLIFKELVAVSTLEFHNGTNTSIDCSCEKVDIEITQNETTWTTYIKDLNVVKGKIEIPLNDVICKGVRIKAQGKCRGGGGNPPVWHVGYIKTYGYKYKVVTPSVAILELTDVNKDAILRTIRNNDYALSGSNLIFKFNDKHHVYDNENASWIEVVVNDKGWKVWTGTSWDSCNTELDALKRVTHLTNYHLKEVVVPYSLQALVLQLRPDLIALPKTSILDKLLASNVVDLPTGNKLKYRLNTEEANLEIHGVSLLWK